MKKDTLNSRFNCSFFNNYYLLLLICYICSKKPLAYVANLIFGGVLGKEESMLFCY